MGKKQTKVRNLRTGYSNAKKRLGAETLEKEAQKQYSLRADLVVHTPNPSTGEAKARDFLLASKTSRTL